MASDQYNQWSKTIENPENIKKSTRPQTLDTTPDGVVTDCRFILCDVCELCRPMWISSSSCLFISRRSGVKRSLCTLCCVLSTTGDMSTIIWSMIVWVLIWISSKWWLSWYDNCGIIQAIASGHLGDGCWKHHLLALSLFISNNLLICSANNDDVKTRNKWKKKDMKKAQRRAAADRSRHKSQWRIQYQGQYFPT